MKSLKQKKRIVDIISLIILTIGAVIMILRNPYILHLLGFLIMDGIPRTFQKYLRWLLLADISSIQ